jgi:hypothetical protein
VWSLGVGIDRRGGDAVGYVACTPDKIHVGKKPGYWTLARKKFIARAASGHASMLHARFKTCGRGDITEAHPFCVRRNNRTVVYGSHNGMVYNCHESAKRNNRTVVVDSEEIFQLMADNDYDGIRKLEGYGVVTTIDPKDPMTINALRLSDNSDIYVVRLTTGGIVYGSTKAIVDEALQQSGLKAECYYDLEIGRIYHFRDDGVYKSNITGVKFAERKWNATGYTGYYSRGKYAWMEKAYRFDWKDEDDDDNDIELDIETVPDSVDQKDDSDKGPLYCESCGQDVDQETADYVSWQYEEFFGRKDTPILCSDCLYDGQSSIAKVC